MKNLFLKTITIGLFLLGFPMIHFGQVEHGVKIYELNVGNLSTIEERTFLIHSIQDHGYSCFRNFDKPNTIDIYKPNATLFDDIDFNALLDTLYDECVDFSYLDKSERGELYVQWRQDLDNEVNFALFESFTKGQRTDNATCETALPFCTDNGAYSFPAGVNSGSPCGNNYDDPCSEPYKCTGTPGQSTNCLYTAPNPAFYYMKIATAGNLNIKIYSQPRKDIDFDCWGPFDNIETACSLLSCSNIVDCSYRGGTEDEFCHINNAQPGKYYILLLTNYSNVTCEIHFENVGSGSTDCSIMPPLVSNDGPFCIGDAIHLSGNGQTGASYSWTGPNGFTSNQQNPTISNSTLAMSGTYTCTITVGNQSSNASTEVQVYGRPTANFTATSVCRGTPTQFNNSSTTNPTGQQMSYLWNFGDGQTSTQQNPSHTYSRSGTYTVTLTASCGNGACSSNKTQTVTVYDSPVANAGNDQSVSYGGVAQLNGSGGTGNFSYHWEPANKVVNPNAQNTQTQPLTASQIFTLTVTSQQGQCTSSDQTTVLVQGSAMSASASASPNNICQGASTVLRATAVGGTGNYTYLWSPTNSLSAPNVANPTAQPSETTTYTCRVSDGQTTQNVNVTVTVHYAETEEEDAYICPGETYSFYDQTCSTPGDYTYTTTTAFGCEKTITLHLHHYPEYDETRIDTAICHGESYVFFGVPYNYTCQQQHTLQTIHGCDSIVRLYLEVYPANDTILDPQSICTSQTLLWHGNVYSQDGQVAYFDTVDYNGCPQVYKLELTIDEYQTPPNYNPNQYVCVPYDDTPHYHWDIANRDYYEDAIDTIIVPGPPAECDYRYTLNLRFHQEHQYIEEVTECDSYYWPMTGLTYTTTDHNLSHEVAIPFGPNQPCYDTYLLDLTVNHSRDTVFEVKSCDDYTWEFGNNQETYSFTESTTLTKTISTTDGCDSIGTLHLVIDYTPNFERVEGRTWVIGGSEFQYTVEDYWIDAPGTHETTWQLTCNGAPFHKWDLEPYGEHYDRCLVFIYTYELDTVYLTATATSTGIGSSVCGNQPHSHSKMIICSSYGVPDEQLPCQVDIYPNPNDGNMTLSISNLIGDVMVKVFDMRGTQVDQFQMECGYGLNEFPYNSSRLTPGIYLFSISSREGILTKKVVIMK